MTPAEREVLEQFSKRMQFKKNLDDLRRYEEGFYDELAKVLG